MSGTKCIYLRGWISSVNMVESNWLASWTETAIKVESKKNTLVVFEIPDTPEGKRATEKIEIFLQEKFGFALGQNTKFCTCTTPDTQDGGSYCKRCNLHTEF